MQLQPNMNDEEFENIQICTISLNRTDRLRLIDVPYAIIEPMRIAISNSWGYIQNEREYHGTYEFKLTGRPWCGQGHDAVRSRQLLVAVLSTMAQYGWNCLQAADISKKPVDKDTLFFERDIPDPNVEMFSISFNKTDRIRIIASEHPEVVLPCVRHAIDSQWGGEIQNGRNYFGSFEFKLKGKPWHAVGSDGVRVRRLLCQMIANMKTIGYKLYASVNISVGKGKTVSDIESWVFRKMDHRTWQ